MEPQDVFLVLIDSYLNKPDLPVRDKIECHTLLLNMTTLYNVVRYLSDEILLNDNAPFGRSTMLLVEMLVPATGVNASFRRVQFVKSVD